MTTQFDILRCLLSQSVPQLTFFIYRPQVRDSSDFMIANHGPRVPPSIVRELWLISVISCLPGSNKNGSFTITSPGKASRPGQASQTVSAEGAGPVRDQEATQGPRQEPREEPQSRQIQAIQVNPDECIVFLPEHVYRPDKPPDSSVTPSC